MLNVTLQACSGQDLSASIATATATPLPHLQTWLQIKDRGPPADDDDSMAAHLVRIQDPATGQLLSDDLLLPQVSVLFWAGFDTTGNTMAWTFYCISQHPEVPRDLAVFCLRNADVLKTYRRCCMHVTGDAVCMTAAIAATHPSSRIHSIHVVTKRLYVWG